MTKEVVTVRPDAPVGEIARLLLAHAISGAPVVDASGMAIGMVSEGDLIGGDDADREARRDWWLELLAEGEPLHPDFLKSLRRPERVARDVMAAPVVRITETTEAAEIARILTEYRIKRVPVVRDGRVVGIVSRADLLRAVSGAVPAPHHDGGAAERLIADVIASVEQRFAHRDDAVAATAPGPGSEAAADDKLSVAAFNGMVANFAHHRAERRNAAREAAAGRRRDKVKELIDCHFTDASWRALTHRAREAAERGEKEFLLLRFPSELCTDGGRAINAPVADWPQTLRGEAAEIYLRWERELKPRGFHLTARVLDFPGGKPGDIGLFLAWGE